VVIDLSDCLIAREDFSKKYNLSCQSDTQRYRNRLIVEPDTMISWMDDTCFNHNDMI
jgi:hypothetical protein